jgi:hypothetical protein
MSNSYFCVIDGEKERVIAIFSGSVLLTSQVMSKIGEVNPNLCMDKLTTTEEIAHILLEQNAGATGYIFPEIEGLVHI